MSRFVHSVIDETDVFQCQRGVNTIAEEIGFTVFAQTAISTAVSELAHNILAHARFGTITVESILSGKKKGIRITSVDTGPGIKDIDQAMQDGYSTAGSLGLGLPSVKRLMDEFEIRSTAGVGTTVIATMWCKN